MSEEDDYPICLERLRTILPINVPFLKYGRIVRTKQQPTVRVEGCGQWFIMACLNAAVQSKPALCLN